MNSATLLLLVLLSIYVVASLRRRRMTRVGTPRGRKLLRERREREGRGKA